MTKDKKILVTGAAGFIGFHLSTALCGLGYQVTGVDNLNEYYDINLKKSRLRLLEEFSNFRFKKLDISDADATNGLFKASAFNYVVNLAAQAGVRYSITNPGAYISSNIVGFMNILEGCRHNKVGHLIYASSSSVYGANQKVPFSVMDSVDHPISLYAATKKSNELMAHSYSTLYGLPVTGLRFFTVYGPYGRPDMALFLFTKAILEGKPIDIFGNGNMKRDFTYIDDIVNGLTKLITHVPIGQKNFDSRNPSTSFAPYRVYNMGNGTPVALLEFIEMLETKLGKKAVRNYLPMQGGDMQETHADIGELATEIGFKTETSVEVGVGRFVDWYLDYNK